MTLLVTALFAFTVLAYLTASVVFAAKIAGRPIAAGTERLGFGALALGGIAHLIHVVVWSLVLHVCPVEGIYFPLSLGANLMVGAFFLLRRRYKLDAVGSVVAPLALATLLASRFAVQATAPSDSLQSALLPFHITANLLGVALFTLASASALLFLVQEGRLKSKKLGGMSRLPPLDALDRAEHRLLIAGFPLLTVGVVTGTLFLNRMHGESGADMARTAFGYGTWLLIALVLFLRQAAGWRGRRAAWGTLVSFGFIVAVLGLYLIRGSAAFRGIS
jgi:ABC-type uncharacterized transport system permease subunit